MNKDTPDNFIVIPFTRKNLDLYVIRTAILKALSGNLSRLHGKLLDAGCGKMPYKDYILNNSRVKDYVGLDIEQALNYDDMVKPDFTWNGTTMPFENESFDCVIATEVLEHCAQPEKFLMEVNRVLVKNGTLFFTVPFLWNLHEAPHDEYRYTPFSLERHLNNSGFSDIRIKATGGWHASMAQMLGLWVKRSPLSIIKKRYLSFLVKPIIKYLLKIEQKEKIMLSEGQMITGLYGVAKK